MILSAKAQERQDTVRYWCDHQLDNKGFEIYAHTPGRGKVTMDRVWMVGGLALTPVNAATNLHVFDNDDHWKIVQREMKINSGLFYHHVDMETWESASMDTMFYRSKVALETTHKFFKPELVSEFPTFTASDLDIGTTQATYPMDAVLLWLDYISGGSTSDEDGHFGLSNDTSLKTIMIYFAETDRTSSINLERSTARPNYEIGYSGTEPSDISFTIETNDETATIEHGESVSFIPHSTEDIIYTFKVIADDNTEESYSVEIADI